MFQSTISQPTPSMFWPMPGSKCTVACFRCSSPNHVTSSFRLSCQYIPGDQAAQFLPDIGVLRDWPRLWTDRKKQLHETWPLWGIVHCISFSLAYAFLSAADPHLSVSCRCTKKFSGSSQGRDTVYVCQHLSIQEADSTWAHPLYVFNHFAVPIWENLL